MTTPRSLVLLAGVSVSALLSLGSGAAHAACNSPGGTPNMPASGDSVRCTGNLDNDGVSGAMSDDVSVRIVGPGGGISTTGMAGIELGNGAIIGVSGEGNRPVNTSGDDAPGIGIGDGGLVTVAGQVTTAGENSGAITTGDGARVVLTSSGLARTGGGMSNAISVGADSRVVLRGEGGDTGALATTGNSNSDAVLLGGSGSTLIVQSGAVVTTSSGMSSPVQADGDGARVIVSGDVRSSSGDATAILGTADDLTVLVQDGGFVTAQSSGSDAIRAEGEGALVSIREGGRVVISSGNSTAVAVGAQGRVIVNGEVSASSSESQGVELGDGAQLIVGSTGSIATSSSNSTAVLVTEDASSSAIRVRTGGILDAIGAQAIRDVGSTNTTVIIDGRVNSGTSQPTFDLGGGSDTVTVNEGGRIEGNSSDPVISMGAGDDSLTVFGTVSGPGTLGDGGPGNDSLTLASSIPVSSSDYINFESTSVVNRAGGGGGGSNQNAARAFSENGGEVATFTIDDDQSGNVLDVSDGATAAVSTGGRAGTLSAGLDGSAVVRSGGSAETLRAVDGGTIDVRSGGIAGTAPGAVANGGRIRFEEGSSARIRAASFAGDADGFGGAELSRGVILDISDSPFLTGETFDDGRFGLEFDDEALRSGSIDGNARGVGEALNRSTLSREDFDAILPGFAGDDIGTAGRTLSDISGEIVVQGAARGIRAVQGFSDMLRPSGTAGGALVAPFEPTARLPLNGRGAVTSQTILPPAAPAYGQPVFGQPVPVQPQPVVVTRPVAVPQPVVLEPRPVVVTQPRPVVVTRPAPVVRPVPVPVAPIPVAPAPVPVTRETGAWAAVFGSTFEVEGGPSSDYDGTTFGGAIGVERAMALGPMREGRVGIAAGYTRTELDNDFRDGEVDGYHVGLYADGETFGLQTAAALSYGYLDVEGGDADTDGHAVNARLDVAYDIGSTFGTDIVFGPVGRLEYTYADFDGASGVGPLGTELDDGDFSQFVVGAGVRFGADYGFGSSRVDLMYEHAFGDDELVFDGSFADGPSFASGALVEDEDRIRLGLGFDYRVGDNAVIGIAYDGTYGDDVVEHGGSLRFTLRF